MKHIYNIIAIVLFTFTFLGCEEDTTVWNESQNALSFASTSVTVGFCDPTAVITLESTAAQSSDMTYAISISDESTAIASEYTLSTNSITIPAGDYVGTTTVDIDFAQLPDDTSRVLLLDIVASDGTLTQARSQTAINYESTCTLNEININYFADAFPAENSLRLVNTDTNDIVIDVAEGDFSADIVFTRCLPAGNYELTVGDPGYSDGFGAGGLVSGELVLCSGNEGLFNDVTGNFGLSTTRTFTLE